MPGTCSPRGGLGHAKLLVSLACVLVVLRGALGGLVHGGGLVHHPLHHPFGPAGPLTVVRHAPPAVPPYSTQVNIFRWLAAFPPPVLHRALVLSHAHPLHHPLHPAHAPPVVHHAAPPPPAVAVPTAPVLPPPAPPLVPAVVKSPAPQLPLGFNFPLSLNFPLGTGFNFPPEALPFAPGVLPTSAFLPTRFSAALPAPFPAPFPTPFPAPFPASPTLKTPLPAFGFAPNGLLPTPAFGAFGPALPPVNFDFAARAPAPPPAALPAPTPSPAGLVFQDGFPAHLRQDFPAHLRQDFPAHLRQDFPAHLRQDGVHGHFGQDFPTHLRQDFPAHLRQDGVHGHFGQDFPAHLRQYVPAANGITRATAGNLAL